MKYLQQKSQIVNNNNNNNNNNAFVRILTVTLPHKTLDEILTAKITNS